MRITRILAKGSTPRSTGAALAIGNFDGVHQGHAAVVGATLQQARTHGLRAAALTFWPHPRRAFAPDSPPFALQSFAQKAACLRALGVEELFVLKFNAQSIALSAADFMQRILHDACGARFVATGEDFAFGHKRSGNAQNLRDFNGFDAVALPHVQVAGLDCSSSAIRRALLAGDVATANRLLGRPFAVPGSVVHGDGRGAAIGFATANIGHARLQLLPKDGVYAVRLRVGETWHDGVANLGSRPTFGASARQLEVHVLQGAPALYGARVEVAFIARLRDEQKFDGVDALKAQIAHDCEAARHALKQAAC